MKFETVLKALDALKGDGSWLAIAERAGIHYDTIARIARGRMVSPGVLIVERIAAAIEALYPTAALAAEAVQVTPPAAPARRRAVDSEPATKEVLRPAHPPEEAHAKASDTRRTWIGDGRGLGMPDRRRSDRHVQRERRVSDRRS